MTNKKQCDIIMGYVDRYPIKYTEGYRSGHNEAVLKTVCLNGHVGSNPTPSANKKGHLKGVLFCWQGFDGIRKQTFAQESAQLTSFCEGPKNASRSSRFSLATGQNSPADCFKAVVLNSLEV